MAKCILDNDMLLPSALPLLALMHRPPSDPVHDTSPDLLDLIHDEV